MPLKIPGVAWRSLTGYDMPAVEKIAAQVHPDFFESLDVLTERQAIYFHGTYLLEVNERPAGYVLSHPWRYGALPTLNTLLGDLPEAPDTYYIHDLALLPVARRSVSASFISVSLAKHARAHGVEAMSAGVL